MQDLVYLKSDCTYIYNVDIYIGSYKNMIDDYILSCYFEIVKKCFFGLKLCNEIGDLVTFDCFH